MRYRWGEKYIKNFGFSSIPVGASLLAKAVCQAPIMLNDRALSLAGSLPQGYLGGAQETKNGPKAVFLCSDNTQPPRYASRTFGSVSSASPVPCMTTRPFSRT
ncbi:hypothetical protein DMX03_14830 [Pseudomonas koreensis]|nr:hypothetical protein DMX03_14830 [Pseudomonas koreensis]